MPATPEQIAKLKQAISDYEAHGRLHGGDREAEKQKAKVRSRALTLLDSRGRSRAELKERLLAVGFMENIVTEVLNDLTDAGLLDDRRFAEEWVRQRSEMRGKSRQVLDQELRYKGIETSLRVEALNTLDPETEKERALELARKKAKSLRSVPKDRSEHDKWLRRIVGMLGRRGFPQGLSFSLGKQALQERIEELNRHDADYS